MRPGPRNLITDVPGLRVGNAEEHRIKTGTTVLVVTHDREMVDNMRRRVVELYEGRVVRDEVSGGYTEESTSEFGLRMRAEMGVGAQGEPRTNGHDHEALR